MDEFDGAVIDLEHPNVRDASYDVFVASLLWFALGALAYYIMGT